MKIRHVLFALSVIFAVLFTGCGRASKTDTPPSGNLHAATPEQSVQTLFKSLQSADASVYNQLIQYKEERHGIFIDKDNKVFGGSSPDHESKEMLKAILGKLSYSIESVKANGRTANVLVKISNRDLSKINILRYEDAANPVIEAIKNTDTPLKSATVHIALNKANNIWKISMDSKLIHALCGGLSFKSFLS